jgi:hypothetical protein
MLLLIVTLAWLGSVTELPGSGNGDDAFSRRGSFFHWQPNPLFPVLPSELARVDVKEETRY